MADVANVAESEEIEVTPEMIEAGAEAILGEVGGADLGGYFSAHDLAISVYRAMDALAPRSGLKPSVGEHKI